MRSKQAPPRRFTIEDLHDDALVAIFQAVPPTERRLLPLVCRRWRAVCDGHLSLWHHVELDFSLGAIEDSSAMYRWLVQRRSAVRRLTVVVETDDDWLALHLVIGLLASTLEQMKLRVHMGRMVGDNILSLEWFSVLDNLKELAVTADAATIEACSSFPPGRDGLTRLCMHVDGPRMVYNLPPGLHKLTTLRELSMSRMNFTISEDLERDEHHPLAPLGSLAALERLEMRRCTLRILPEELTKMTNLKSCSLSRSDGFSMEQLARPEGSFPQLEALNLSGCELEELPACIMSLPRLAHLDLGFNRLRGLPDGPALGSLSTLDLSSNRFKNMPAVLLTCKSLRTLKLEGCWREDRGDKPPAFFSMRLKAKELRELLEANPHMCELSIPCECGLSSRTLARLRSSFPGANMREVEGTGMEVMPDASADEYNSAQDSDFSAGSDFESGEEYGSSDDELYGGGWASGSDEDQFFSEDEWSSSGDEW